MAGPTDLYDMAAELLTVSTAALATTPAGAPGRAFVSIAAPSFDCCDQLTVHVPIAVKDTWQPNQAPGDQFHRLRGGSVNLVTFVATVLRCVPVMEAMVGPALPTPAQLDASALETYTDGWTLWNYLQGRIRDNTLWAGFPCRDVQISPLSPINPQGGCAGWFVALVVGLGGYAA